MGKCSCGRKTGTQPGKIFLVLFVSRSDLLTSSHQWNVSGSDVCYFWVRNSKMRVGLLYSFSPSTRNMQKPRPEGDKGRWKVAGSLGHYVEDKRCPLPHWAIMGLRNRCFSHCIFGVSLSECLALSQLKDFPALGSSRITWAWQNAHCLTLPSEFQNPEVWGGAWKFSLLTNFLVMLMLLMWRPHLKTTI